MAWTYRHVPFFGWTTTVSISHTTTTSTTSHRRRTSSTRTWTIHCKECGGIASFLRSIFFFFFFWSPQLKRNRRTLFSPTFPEITFFQPRRCQRYFLPLSSTIFQYCIVHYPNTLNLGNNEFYHLHQSAIGFFNLLILFLNFMLPSSPFFLSPFSSNDRIHAMLMWDQSTFSLPLFSHCHHVPNLSGFHWYAVLHWYVSSQGWSIDRHWHYWNFWCWRHLDQRSLQNCQ